MLTVVRTCSAGPSMTKSHVDCCFVLLLVAACGADSAPPEEARHANAPARPPEEITNLDSAVKLLATLTSQEGLPHSFHDFGRSKETRTISASYPTSLLGGDSLTRCVAKLGRTSSCLLVRLDSLATNSPPVWKLSLAQAIRSSVSCALLAQILSTTTCQPKT